MEFSVSTNGYNVVSSGTVLLYDANSDLKLSVKASDEFSFDVILRFIQTDERNQSIDKEINGNTITFKCYNFNNSLGTGTRIPLPIATVAGNDILLHFWSYLMGERDSSRKVEYTLLEKA